MRARLCKALSDLTGGIPLSIEVGSEEVRQKARTCFWF